MTLKAMHAQAGDRVRFSKTIAESDVYLFAGITGDFSGNHVDAEFMRDSMFGARIAHGALLVGFMSTCSTMLIEKNLELGIDSTPVSLGYDRMRFVAPVYFGDTITVHYTVSHVDYERRRTTAMIEIVNQKGDTVAVAEHAMKWVRRKDL
jgi:3-hydroxybutyryl-CoA dehydratase